MREIKFRVWDKQDNFMHYGDIWIDGETGQVLLCGDYNAQNIELMQYTGLKDKNGKEIYEGDIVKTEDGIITEVKFDDCIDTDRYWQFCSGWLINIIGTESSDTANSIEVIGNIWENPELLEEE